MAPSILYPPSQLSPAGALALSQQAPAILRSSASTVSASTLTTLLTGSEKAELWLQYENLILSCLRTGDDLAANACLKRLTTRFGSDNERVQALGGLVKEAEAKNNGELEAVLKEYDQILGDNETNIVRPRPSPRCCCISRWLTRVAACRKEAGRALAVHGSPSRRGVGSRATPRLFADRFRGLVGAVRYLPIPGPVSAGDLRPRGGPGAGAQCMECMQSNHGLGPKPYANAPC